MSAYLDLERMIVFQEIAPGALVSESELMERTHLGRTPVREALQRLAVDGLVEIIPNRGISITAISAEAELHTLELRRVLEVLAVRLACERSREPEREQMIALIEAIPESAGSPDEYIRTVRSTHELIVASAHNPYLARAMAPLQGLSRRFWLAHLVEAGVEIARGSEMHVRILRSIIDRNREDASQASVELNSYLVDFTLRTLGRLAPGPQSMSSLEYRRNPP